LNKNGVITKRKYRVSLRKYEVIGAETLKIKSFCWTKQTLQNYTGSDWCSFGLCTDWHCSRDLLGNPGYYEIGAQNLVWRW